MAEPQAAHRDQPPFPASAMDGYALRDAEVRPGARFRIIGEAAAGRAYGGPVGPGEAVRIFTGAPVPEGADRIVIQEDATRDGDALTLGKNPTPNRYIRPAGGDFVAGFTLDAPRRLTPSDIALLAAMNVAEVPVARKPIVALLATGDELVPPGGTPGPDQIIASNSYGLHALLRQAGAEPRLLPIAADDRAALETAFGLAEGADLIVTSGGASVGNHDLVAPVAETLGMERAFYRVAMRPGKPLMAGRLAGAAMVGLPGNPVSAMVCGHIFILPIVRAMLGLGTAHAPRRKALLAADLAPNGPREHYMRAAHQADGTVRAFDRQDSSLLSVLAGADCLIVRPPNDHARPAGTPVDIVDLA